MKVAGPCLWLVVAAAAILLPPTQQPLDAPVRMVDEFGRDQAVATSFAYLAQPDRSRATPFAPIDDLAYTLVDSGPIGGAILLVLFTLPIVLVGIWGRGLQCGLRRVLVVLGLAAPVGLALLYHSCFLPGRRPVLGPEARFRYVLANFHAQTDHSTGFLRPIDVVRWHRRRGIHVLNISDRDSIEGALAAQRALAEDPSLLRSDPPMVVLVGEEYHGEPDVVLVHSKRSYDPKRTVLEDIIAGVHADGGALIVAHPWSKLKRPLAGVLQEGVDGVEVVNGVIHGGRHVVEAALGDRSAPAMRKALIGSLDYKLGPHVSALTLVPRAALLPYDPSSPPSAGKSAAMIVRTIRSAQTRVLYAIPGTPRTGTSWEVGRFGPAAALAGLRTLYASSRGRRLMWLLWVVVLGGLWKLATRKTHPPRRLGRWRILFVASCAVQLLLLAALSWQVRGIVGVVPVSLLVKLGALFAVPLLASAHMCGCGRPDEQAEPDAA
ncbi:MAG: PHP domain-containing protein [Planctomycetota bacterium]|nr:hypothetical protein [Planctomycetota bacterium]